MDEISAHEPNGTPIDIKVKLKDSATPVGNNNNNSKGPILKKTVTLTIKDRFLQGITEAAKEKNLTIPQYIIETLENQLIKEQKLPSWWHSRQF